MTSDFDAKAFLEWLDDIDDYYVKQERVAEEWPGFYEATGGLVGVTMVVDDDGNSLVPVGDYRQKVIHGKALD